VLRVEHVPLLALTLTAFAMGTAELIPNGLLPLIASDLGVAVSRAGWVTTCFALGVMVGGPALAACTMRVPRKPLVLGMTVVFLMANVAMTLATTLSWALALRFVAGSMLGGFLGLGITIAVGLVPAQRQATSIAVIFLGFTISNVLSVPLGNVVGRHSGWAAAFWVVVVLAALGLVAMWLAVPGPSGEGHSEDLGFGMLRNGRLWVHFVAMAFGYGGVFALYTYIAPFLTDVAGFASGSVAWILLLFGIGVIAGNPVGTRTAPPPPRPWSSSRCWQRRWSLRGGSVPPGGSCWCCSSSWASGVSASSLRCRATRSTSPAPARRWSPHSPRPLSPPASRSAQPPEVPHSTSTTTTGCSPSWGPPWSSSAS
jgi:predicted MFS family arabinose efflux permease